MCPRFAPLPPVIDWLEYLAGTKIAVGMSRIDVSAEDTAQKSQELQIVQEQPCARQRSVVQ